MCNPRRVRVTATRQLQEAWQHEVERTVEVTGRVAGEARVRQPLDATLGGPTARALVVLAADGSGWVEDGGNYRFDVEGGYAVYQPEERALEIVAVLEEELRATGAAGVKLTGQTARAATAEGEGTYDPGWDHRTEEMARRDAEVAAEQNLNAAQCAALKADRERAEAEADPALRAAAEAEAREKLARRAVERQQELAEQARRHLTAVGLRCREAFHQALGRAYRDAILAYARQHQAEGVQCAEIGDTIEIEFRVRREREGAAMDIKVRFRFNKATGQVEVFEVADDEVAPLHAAEYDAAHNAAHDKIAAELGNVIERNAKITEVLPGTAVRADELPPETETPEGRTERQKDRRGTAP